MLSNHYKNILFNFNPSGNSVFSKMRKFLKKLKFIEKMGIEVQFFADSSVKISLFWETLYIFGKRKLRRIFLCNKINFDFFSKKCFF